MQTKEVPNSITKAVAGSTPLLTVLVTSGRLQGKEIGGIPENLHQGKRFVLSSDSHQEISLEGRKTQEHFSLLQITS